MAVLPSPLGTRAGQAWADSRGHELPAVPGLSEGAEPACKPSWERAGLELLLFFPTSSGLASASSQFALLTLR